MTSATELITGAPCDATLPCMSSTLAAALVKAIRAERARTGMTQDELADRLKWSRPQIYKIEAGKRRLYMDEMPEICKALGTDLMTLLVAINKSDRDALGL